MVKAFEDLSDRDENTMSFVIKNKEKKGLKCICLNVVITVMVNYYAR